jgi:hypothetical protein
MAERRSSRDVVAITTLSRMHQCSWGRGAPGVAAASPKEIEYTRVPSTSVSRASAERPEATSMAFSVRWARPPSPTWQATKISSGAAWDRHSCRELVANSTDGPKFPSTSRSRSTPVSVRRLDSPRTSSD